jgi:predicted TPR repeat methyltransferase
MSDALQQARSLFLEGNGHFTEDRLPQALACFEAAAALAPGRPSVLANLGVTQSLLGRWHDAIPNLQASTRDDPAQPDAWLALGRCLGRLGDAPAALEAFERALACDPTLAEAWSARGGLLRDAGRLAQAAVCFERALALGADDGLHRFYLASVQGGVAPPQPPRDYVEALFDQYAGEFEQHLVQGLQYRAHEILLQPLLDGPRRFAHVLDLGCGTGLCGRLIHGRALSLDGVDLSLAMVQQARATGVYRDVVHGDLLAFLQATDETADLVIAADVFIYVGALEAVFAAVRRRLRAGASFAFSVELSAGEEDLRLLPSLRYAHAPAYVQRLAAEHGFRMQQQWQAPIRHDQGIAVPGLYVVLEPTD